MNSFFQRPYFDKKKKKNSNFKLPIILLTENMPRFTTTDSTVPGT